MENKNYITIGDTVIVSRGLASLSHPHTQKAHQGTVVGFYRNFFNVQYEDGWQQSIMYRDINKIKLVV